MAAGRSVGYCHELRCVHGSAHVFPHRHGKALRPYVRGALPARTGILERDAGGHGAFQLGVAALRNERTFKPRPFALPHQNQPHDRSHAHDRPCGGWQGGRQARIARSRGRADDLARGAYHLLRRRSRLGRLDRPRLPSHVPMGSRGRKPHRASPGARAH